MQELRSNKSYTLLRNAFEGIATGIEKERAPETFLAPMIRECIVGFPDGLSLTSSPVIRCSGTDDIDAAENYRCAEESELKFITNDIS